MTRNHEKNTMPLSAQVFAGLISVSSFIAMTGGCDEVLNGTQALAEGVGSIATYDLDGVNQPPSDGQVSAEPQISIPSAAELVPAEITPTLPTEAPTTPPAEDCIGGTYDGWYFDPNADSIIDTVDYPAEKREFLKFALRGICEAVRNGAPINPLIAFTQASLESDSGTDTLAPYNNFFGHKAGKDDPFVEVWTKEDYDDGNGLVDVLQKFTVYESPTGSFLDYADMIGRLEWYNDAEACHNQAGRYLASLQHELDPATCRIIRHQGEEGVLSYATDKNYETNVWNRAGHIKAAEYIYQP